MPNNLDRTCDSIEEWIFLNHHKELLKNPNPNWHFDKTELDCIAIMYYKLLKEAGCEVKQELPSSSVSEVLHKSLGMADNFLEKRMFRALGGIQDSVPLEKWISAISLLLRGTPEQQIDFCFKVYDSSETGIIRRDQMVNLLRRAIYMHFEEQVEAAVNDLVDVIIQMMDKDKDGMISYQDYKTTVLEKPLLLECFGPCIPDHMSKTAFLMTFTDKIKI